MLPHSNTTTTYSLFAETFQSNYSFSYPVPRHGGKTSYSFTVRPHTEDLAHHKPETHLARLKHSDLFHLPFGDFNVARNWITFTSSKCDVATGTSPSLIDGFFLGIVSSWRLECLGRLTFHGSVVQKRERAIAIIADKGVGKSTLTTFLVSMGFALLNDDMVVIRESEKGSFEALPGFPQIRNYPPVLDLLVSNEVDRFPVGDHTEKCWVRVGACSKGFGEFCPVPRQLEAIYHLTRGPTVKPVVTPIVGRETFKTLTTFSYPVSLFRHFTNAETTNRFQRVSRLVASVPVFRLSIPDALDDLPQVADLLTP